MSNATKLVRILRDALQQIDDALVPEDWAGDRRMLDITGPAIAKAEKWLTDGWIIDIANEVHRAMPAGSDEQEEIVAIVRAVLSELGVNGGV